MWQNFSENIRFIFTRFIKVNVKIKFQISRNILIFFFKSSKSLHEELLSTRESRISFLFV